MDGNARGGVEDAVTLTAAGARLDANYALPAGARGVVAFAHGSGSGRHSPRNQAVAAGLRRAGIGTLLLDLLTEEELVDRRTRELRFDIDLLARRLTGAVDWLAGQAAEDGGNAETSSLPVGTFGASTGAAAALITAANRPELVRTVVSRGGRPDLAVDTLGRVRVPVLLIVGGADPAVGALNQRAAALLSHAELRTIPGATHLFEEPGALEQVTRLAAEWFVRWLPGRSR